MNSDVMRHTYSAKNHQTFQQLVQSIVGCRVYTFQIILIVKLLKLFDLKKRVYMIGRNLLGY
jgi:hypothetical protein